MKRWLMGGLVALAAGGFGLGCHINTSDSGCGDGGLGDVCFEDAECGHGLICGSDFECESDGSNNGSGPGSSGSGNGSGSGSGNGGAGAGNGSGGAGGASTGTTFMVGSGGWSGAGGSSSTPCESYADCPVGEHCDADTNTCAPGEPACADLADESSCVGRADCEPVYAGVNCSCGPNCQCQPGEAGCVCESFEYFKCTDV